MHLGVSKWIHQDVIDSTQTHLLSLLPSVAKSDGVYVCSAYHQTVGRGTRGRQWLSSGSDPSMCLSVAFRAELIPQVSIPVLVVAYALAGIRAVKELSKEKVDCSIKWPNDIVLRGKKVGGVLGELVEESGQPIVVLGMGINCTVQPQTLDPTSGNPVNFNWPPTSILNETGVRLNCMDLSKLSVSHFMQSLSSLKSSPRDGIVSVLESVEHILAYKGKSVTVDYDSPDVPENKNRNVGYPVDAIVIGIDHNNAGLVLQRVDNSRCTISEGRIRFHPDLLD